MKLSTRKLLATTCVVGALGIVLAGCASNTNSSGSSSGGSAATKTVASTMILGGPPEWKTRSNGVPGLQKVYGLAFQSFKALDADGPLTINALKNGQVDAADLFTTDPTMEANGFVCLNDPKNLYPAQNIVPLITKADATAGVAKVLNGLSAKLTTADLTTLNKKVIIDKDNPDTVARSWLSANGLNQKTTDAHGVSLTVGSANFQEDITLADIYADALQNAGATITKKLNIGSRETYIPGLQDGSINLIPEYTGDLLQYFNSKATESSSSDVYAALKKALPAKLAVLDQAPGQDKDCIGVRKQTAQKYKLTSISDLTKPLK